MLAGSRPLDAGGYDGSVDDPPGAALFERVSDCPSVADVAVHMAQRPRQGIEQPLRPLRRWLQTERDDGLATAEQQLEQIQPDESGPACNEDRHVVR